MAKKTTGKKTTSQIINDHFNSEVCKLKHAAIDKEFQIIREDANKKHDELVGIIEGLRTGIKEDYKEAHDNLKDKIVLTEKMIGDKIDSLSEFDDTLKGNGSPGVWETVRGLKWRVRGIIALLFIIIILVLGGNFKGITVEKIKGLFGAKTGTKQVEEGPYIHAISGELLAVDEEGHIVVKKENQAPKIEKPK